MKYEELKEIIVNIDDFKNDIKKYTSPIIYCNPLDEENPSFGSGVFVKIDKYYGVLTADHVAKIFIDKKTKIISLPKFDTAELLSVKIAEIIRLPEIIGFNSFDLSFIRIDEIQQIFDLDKVFYDLKNDADTILNSFLKKTNEFQCFGFFGVPSEGKEIISSEKFDKCNFYPYGGFYLGDIEKKSYLESPFYFPINYLKNIHEKEFRIDEFKMYYQKNSDLPSSFIGISGSGIFRAKFIKENSHYKYVKVHLVGIAISENTYKQEILFHGPVSIYKTFLKYCSTYLQTQNIDSALESAAIN